MLSNNRCNIKYIRVGDLMKAKVIYLDKYASPFKCKLVILALLPINADNCLLGTGQINVLIVWQ